MKSFLSTAMLVLVVACDKPGNQIVDQEPEINLSGVWKGIVYKFYDVEPSDAAVTLTIVDDSSGLSITAQGWIPDTISQVSFTHNDLNFTILRTEIDCLFSGTYRNERIDGLWYVRAKPSGQVFTGNPWFIAKDTAASHAP